MIATAYPHIAADEHGTLFIADTRVKLAILIENHLAYGADAAQLHKQFPDVSLAQAYAALAYYYDHREQVDQEIQRRRAATDEWIARQDESPARRRLAGLKKTMPE